MVGDAPLVLCVEDDIDTQEMLRLVLGDRGFGFQAVDNCSDALRLATSPGVAVVLLDNLLRDGSGIDLCERIRKADSDLPIIFISGSVFGDEKEAALNAGANAFLTKPFALDSLFEVLDGLEIGPRASGQRPGMDPVACR